MSSMNTQEAALGQAIADLEESIVLGLLSPGMRLTEDSLMGQFGLKRHVARQAFAELEVMGLVERKRNAGATVRVYSTEEVEALYAVRTLLETHAAGLIKLPMAEAQLEHLVQIQHDHDRAVAAGDLRAAFRANLLFHDQLFSFSANPVLIEAIRTHSRRAHAIRFSSLVRPELLERARNEHWAMIDAIKSKNGARLVELCRAHLTPSLDTYLSLQRSRGTAIAASM